MDALNTSSGLPVCHHYLTQAQAAEGLNPVPVLEVPVTLETDQIWGLLSETDPIESLEYLSLHVAGLTMCVAMLRDEIEWLKSRLQTTSRR